MSDTFPEAVLKIQKAEQDIVRCVETSAEFVEELSKFGDADFETVSRLADQFLTDIKEAQQLLLEAVRTAPTGRVFQGRAYIEKLQADALEEKARAIKALLAARQQQPEAEAAGAEAAGPTAMEST